MKQQWVYFLVHTHTNANDVTAPGPHAQRLLSELPPVLHIRQNQIWFLQWTLKHSKYILFPVITY